MEFSVLGPLEVRADGRAVALGGVKPRAVLAVLLLRANQPVTRRAARARARALGWGRVCERGEDGAGPRVAAAARARGASEGREGASSRARPDSTKHTALLR